MIYMDNAAMTKPRKEVISEVTEYMNYRWYNPSSAYKYGKRVKDAIEEARCNIAKLINANPDEIHFTSGATESASIIINSIKDSDEIYISEGEHACVDVAINSTDSVAIPITRYGEVKYKLIPVEGYDYGNATLFVIGANNEVGTINPLKEIGEFCRDHGILFVSDLTQAVGHIPIDVKDFHIDFAFGSGQKFGGISGCGFLYVKKKYECLIKPLCNGGEQDIFKSGTENIYGIIAMGVASKCAMDEMEDSNKYLIDLRDYMISEIKREIPDAMLIGHPLHRLPNNVNFAFKDIDSESIIQYLDLYDICASAGSACHSKNVEPSHVLKAMKIPEEYINGCIRFSLSTDNTKEEVDEVIKVLKLAIKGENNKYEL